MTRSQIGLFSQREPALFSYPASGLEGIYPDDPFTAPAITLRATKEVRRSNAENCCAIGIKSNSGGLAGCTECRGINGGHRGASQ